jgi:hypothetical protein
VRFRYRDLPPVARLTILPAALLCGLAVVGASSSGRFELALLPAGILLVIGGADLRNLRGDFSANPRVMSVLAVVLGCAWGAIGIAALGDLLR